MPGLSILHKSDTIITRGGQNTMIASIIAGTPSVGFPCDSAEADFNMRTVEKFKLGILGKEEDFNFTFLVEALQKIDKNQTFRENCSRFAAKIESAGGAIKTIDVIEKLLN